MASLASAIVVECITPKTPSKIEELRGLATSRGYKVLGEIVQYRDKLDPAYVIGRGKLNTLKKLVVESGANNVIFSNTLKAGQAFRVRKWLGWEVNVIDRNLLILEIFEQRAMTKEAKLQIELARLQYTLPWTREFVRYRNLYGEQVGFGAMGEYLHKTYETGAKRRISMLKQTLQKAKLKSLMKVEKRREAGLPIVSLAGYTQAGKTTFFNFLTKESKPTGLGPFTTLSSFARRIRIGGSDLILIDSIGFIEDLHPLILDAFNVTLSEISMSNAILLIVDVSDSLNVLSRRALTSKEILARIAPAHPKLICPNKVDLLTLQELKTVYRVLEEIFPSDAIMPISALKGEGIQQALLKLKVLINFKT